MPKKSCTCSCGHKHVPKPAQAPAQPAPAQPAPAPPASASASQPAPSATPSAQSAKKLSKYQQFVKAKLPGMKDVPHKDRMRKVSMMWKELQDDEAKKASSASSASSAKPEAKYEEKK